MSKLSGEDQFIITRTALREPKLPHAQAIRNFYIRRFFHIVPPFFAYLISLLILSNFELIHPVLVSLPKAAAFACNLPIGPNCEWFVGHSWSLAFEEQFYLLFPLFFLYLPAKPQLKYLILCIVLLVYSTTFSYSDNKIVANVRFFAHIFSFIACGGLFACYEAQIAQISSHQNSKILSLVLVLALLFHLTLIENAGPEFYGWIFESALLPPSLAWLVVSSLYQQGWAHKLLRGKRIQFVGTISYSLFLWQQLFTASRTEVPHYSILSYPVLMLPAALLSFHFIEKPSIRLGRALIAKMNATKT